MIGFKSFTQLLFEESGFFIIMFFVTGIAFNVLAEFVKKQIFPRRTEEEIKAGAVQKNCPKWLGMIIGLVLTAIFIACSLLAHLSGTAHSMIIGGVFFTPVWFVIYYLYQMAAMRLVKCFLTFVAPGFMTGHGRKKRPQKPIYQVPRGAKVEYVDAVEEEAATDKGADVIV